MGSDLNTLCIALSLPHSQISKAIGYRDSLDRKHDLPPAEIIWVLVVLLLFKGLSIVSLLVLGLTMNL